MSNQDIDGNVPPAAPAATPAAPDSLEQQLEKERDARALMRERLRHTEALAAESHALRARMAEELERVTADRDRLRAEGAAGASTAAAPGATTAKPAAARVTEPLYTPTMTAVPTPHAADRPLKPPAPAARKGPWAALAMLSVLAVAVAGAAWYKSTLPGARDAQVAATPVARGPVDAASSQNALSAQPVVVTTPAASAAVASAAPSSGAVPLPPLTPEAQLAAAPTAAGPAAPADTSGLPARLRKALDGEGIASSVDVDAATGHLRVADAQNDDALRQRTDMVIRAVYAGASLPEPQIEHRWLSPMHGTRETTAAADTSTAAPRSGSSNTEHRKATTNVAVASVDALTPVLPAGRVTESCMQELAAKATVHRANMTACMKHSCCSSAASHNSEECRAYDKAYPFTCGGG